MQASIQSPSIPQTSSFMPSYASMLSRAPSVKGMLAPGDYAVWLLGVTLQLVAMILMTFHGPKDGDTASDTTFLWAGWGTFAVGTIIVLVKIFMLRK